MSSRWRHCLFRKKTLSSPNWSYTSILHIAQGSCTPETTVIYSFLHWAADTTSSPEACNKKSMGFGVGRSCILMQTFCLSGMTLGTSHHLSEPQLPHPKSEDFTDPQFLILHFQISHSVNQIHWVTHSAARPCLSKT